MVRVVAVNLAEKSYRVQIGADLLAAMGSIVQQLGQVRNVVIIADEKVGAIYGERARAAMRAAGEVRWVDFPACEKNKTMETWVGLQNAVLGGEPKVDRQTVIVALGGGVTTDMAGFVAATCLRGLRWVAVPTTLLGAVDASVGGKTGVDHPAGKNLIGAFHQPSAVVIDVETLATLPPSQLANGLAECVKHAVIRDAGLLEFIEGNAAGIAQCQQDVMTELVARNVEIKAAVVSADEKEAGEREHLNFGHTVGHAIETLTMYGIGHGTAVALGMVAANRIAVRRGMLEAGVAERIEGVLATCKLPTRVGGDGFGAEKIWELMQQDKKARGGKVRMVLASGLGRVGVYDDVTADQVADAVEYMNL